jgi:hypothetical protein
MPSPRPLCESFPDPPKKSPKIPRFFPQSVFLPRENVINSCAFPGLTCYDPFKKSLKAQMRKVYYN